MHCEKSGRYYADGTDVEVVRMATKRLTTKLIAGEGGARGCFFFNAPGSGIFLNVGRSLRSRDRVSAAHTLGVDVAMVFGGYLMSRYDHPSKVKFLGTTARVKQI